jgi:hypothetical protein
VTKEGGVGEVGRLGGLDLAFLGAAAKLKRRDSMNLASFKPADALIIIENLDVWHFLGASILGLF